MERSTTAATKDDESTNPPSTTQKVVKNFNEFLNFASAPKTMALRTPPLNCCSSDIDQSVNNAHNEHDPNKDEATTTTTTAPKLQLNLADRRCSVDGSSPDDSQEYYPMTTSMTRELRLEMESLDRCVFGDDFPTQRLTAALDHTGIRDISYTQLSEDANLEEIIECPSDSVVQKRLRNGATSENALKRISACSANTDVFLWENPLHQFSPSPSTMLNDFEGGSGAKTTVADVYVTGRRTPDEQKELEFDDTAAAAATPKSFIETTTLGRKSITPIRLIRRPFDVKRRDTTTTKRYSSAHSSSCSANNSDSSDAEDYSWNGTTTADGKSLPTNIPSSPIRQSQSNNHLVGTTTAELSTSVEEAAEAAQLSMTNAAAAVGALPAPHDFGGGNPFLMFLCLTLLLQHRNYVIKSNMDYNEMAMHFDKMVRKHNVTRVLNQARRMYADYLKAQKMVNVVGLGVVSDNMTVSATTTTAATSSDATPPATAIKNNPLDVKT